MAQAAETVSISVDTSKGYARIIFGWPTPVAADATIADGILVITFARPFQFAPGVLNVPLDDYVSVIKQDASMRTLRLSLTGKFRVQKSVGGPLVAVDLLPATMASLPGVRMAPVEATYLAWIDVRDLRLAKPAAHFEVHGIGLSDGADFGAPGWLRLNFGCPRATLDEALSRFERAVRAA